MSQRRSFARQSRSALAAVLACLGLLLAPDAVAKRFALVIGNDIYTEPVIPDLRKARNDARSMGVALENAGFEVDVLLDAGRRDINAAMQRLTDKLNAGDVALFFYAGHGVEFAGRNYLVPTDAPDPNIGGQDLIRAESVSLDSLLQQLRRSKARVAISIIDACRENPFERPGSTRSINRGQGLARIEPPSGSFVLFSAGAGQRALDELSETDPNANSVFTRRLLPLMSTPDLDIRQLAVRLKRDVKALAATADEPHEQTPAYYDELLGDFAFIGSAAPKSAPVVRPPSPAEREAQLALGSDARARIQSALQSQGFDPKGIDGQLGPGSRAAISAWQQQSGYEPTGYLAADQADALLTPPPESRPRTHPSAWKRGRTANGRYIDDQGCAREANGDLILCPHSGAR